MYITQIQLKNIRVIREAEWEVPKEQAAGWHVVIGDNGSGKSAFLRAVALALVGREAAAALRQDWDDWLRVGEQEGSVRLTLRHDSQFDQFSGKGRTPDRPLRVGLRFERQGSGVRLLNESGSPSPERHVWGDGWGWFSAGYGPFRRFAGGDRESERIFLSNPGLAAHLSLFGENVALTEALRWLQELRFKWLEKNAEGALLSKVRAFVNQEGFLPHRTRLTNVTSEEVEFSDANGCRVAVRDLSDGYRAMLSMTFELIRQLARVYGPEWVFEAEDPTSVNLPGVVLIDEIDAHLHPTWQHRVGRWLRQHFPRMQFIVTTHSPLICQAADVGSVWRLPRPGTDEAGGMVTGKDLERLLYGNVLDAYGTQLFGEGVTRSEEGKQRLERLAELNWKQLHGELTAEEQAEQQDLRASQPTAADTLTVAATPTT